MNEVLDLIRQNGDLFYLITFLWTALEGETFVIFAALAAQRGLLQVDLLFLAAALGSMFGDQCFFFAGRFFGKKIVHRYPKLIPKLRRIFGLIEAHDKLFILSYRFMYGVRNISALAIGMSQISWRRFAVLNAAASFLWSFVFCAGGYTFGVLMKKMRPDEDAINLEVRGLMIAALALFVLFVVARIFQSRRKNAELSPDGVDAP